MLDNRIQNIKFTEALFHLIFWLLATHFIFDLSGLYHSYEHLVFSQNDYFDEAFIFLPLCTLLFYWNFLFLIPRFLLNGRWIIFSIALISSILLTVLFSALAYDIVESNGYKFHIHQRDYLDNFMQFSLVAIIVSSLVRIAKRTMRNVSTQKKIIEKQKEAEMKYLRSQFSPHFLYNSLNGIYSKAIEEDAAGTAEAVVTLSEIMRYPLSQDLKQEAMLKEEVKFINDYIAMQKIRLGDDYPIIFNYNITSEEIKILPLSLIELVSNAFKYGVSQKNKSPIIFELEQKKDSITFRTTNTFSNTAKVNSNKIGLKNLRARLQLYYENNYSLITRENGNQFESVLELSFRNDKRL